MSIIFNRNDGTESLNQRESFLRLVSEGFVSSFDTLETSSNGTVYEYKITVPRPIDDKAFLIFVKSDYDKLSRLRSATFSTNSMDFYFISSKDINKEYKYFAPYSFETFSTNTDYGMKVLSNSGEILYDSRVKECLLKDYFLVSGPTETITHSETPDAWYSISSFPRGVSFKGVNEFQNEYRFWSFEQKTTTSLEVSEYIFRGSVENPSLDERKFVLPPSNMILLDRA